MSYKVETAVDDLVGPPGAAIGVDIVSIKKIADILDRHAGAAESLFTSSEIRYARSGANESERFAARFAAKEAVLKALGTGMAKGMTWQQIEVASLPSGRPTLRLTGAVFERARHLGLDQWLISLAHCREFAVAYVSAANTRTHQGASVRGEKPTTVPAIPQAHDQEAER